ncbi:hypothetical protein MHYP_G00347900 [Metynnis hypsauchen]
MFKFDPPFATPSVNPEPSMEPKSTPSPNSTRAATEENAETCSPSKGFGCNEALIEPDTVVPKFNPRNQSPDLKLSVGVWILWLIYAAGNFAI